MEVAAGFVTAVVVVLAVTALSHRWNLSAPLALLVIGAGASWLPFVPEIRLEPEVVLLGILPPLLYGTAIRTSAIDFKHNLRPIGMLSVLLVAVTATVVGLVAWALLPIPYAVGFALGAVVAPPDAVAATAVARKIGLPRRVVTILEGESLVNDATAITCLRVAILAIAGAITAWEVAANFALAAGGGIVIGLVIAVLFSRIRRSITNPVFDTACSLLIPFVAYLPAEAVQSSGVIAVVTAGIVLGHRAPVLQTAESRVNERVNWRTIQFLLENTVFLLIGLQARWIVDDVLNTELGTGRVIGVSLVVLGTVIAVRLAWVLATRVLLRTGKALSPADSVIVGWAGMRGVVTLAAALLLPSSTPYREVVVFTALVVTAGTLLLQGLTLGPLARRIGAHGPDAREDALQVAHVMQRLTNASLERLAEMEATAEAKEAVADRLRTRSNALWERIGKTDATPAEEYRQLRLATLQSERADLLRWRGQPGMDQEIVAEALQALDMEEAMLNRVSANLDPIEAGEELPADAPSGPCEDLAQAPHQIAPLSQDCEQCRVDGVAPVRLRLCLECGHVGCCDSSPGRHASAHYRDTGHPVMRSFEAGERWRWCYRHEELG